MKLSKFSGAIFWLLCCTFCLAFVWTENDVYTKSQAAKALDLEDDGMEEVSRDKWQERAIAIRSWYENGTAQVGGEEGVNPYILPRTIHEIDLGSPIPIADTTSFLRAGMLTAHLPGKSGATCIGACHSNDDSYFSSELNPVGKRGDYDWLYDKCYPETIKPDIPKETSSRTILNIFSAENTLNDGALSRAGMNKEIPYDVMVAFNNANAADWSGVYLQFIAGSEVHDMTDLLEIIKADERLVALYEKATGSKQLNEITLLSVVGVWEKSIVSCETNTQKFWRGEIDELHNPKGFVLFYDEYNCQSCHEGGSMGNTKRAKGIVESENVGFFRVTKDSADWKMFRVPQLNNLKDAAGLTHKQIDISTYKVLGLHEETYGMKISAAHKRALQSFILMDNYDAECVSKSLSYY